MEPVGRQSFPPVEAGAVLITLTLIGIALGAGLGWLAGAVGIGILIGAVLAVPAGVFAVYRRYRGYFT
jgi:hypothetical protein